MFKLGEIKSGKEIGKVPPIGYIWAACAICGEERWVELRKGKPRYAICHHCAMEAVNNNSSGANNPNWKGGEKHHTGGYILVYKPEHLRANCDGYIRRGRLVLEEKLGRPLKLRHVAHHINGIKDDDRPENLGELSILEHELIHANRHKPRDKKGKYLALSKTQ